MLCPPLPPRVSRLCMPLRLCFVFCLVLFLILEVPCFETVICDTVCVTRTAMIVHRNLFMFSIKLSAQRSMINYCTCRYSGSAA